MQAAKIVIDTSRVVNVIIDDTMADGVTESHTDEKEAKDNISKGTQMGVMHGLMDIWKNNKPINPKLLFIVMNSDTYNQINETFKGLTQ